MLQKHPFARRRSLGPHQGGRNRGQSGVGGPQGRPRHAEDRRSHRHGVDPGEESDLQISHRIHDLPGVKDDKGDQGAAHQQSHDAAAEGGQEPVTHVFPGDSPPAVAQGLQPADLYPLLLHHSGHGSEAHQRRHQEENEGEYLGQIAHPLRVLVVGHISRVGIPAQDVPFAVLDLGDLPPGVVQLPPGVGELFLGLGLGVLILRHAVGVLLFPVLKLNEGIVQLLLGLGGLPGQLSLGVLQLGQPVLVLHPAIVQLLPGVRQLHLAVGKLLGRVLQFLLRVTKLGFSVTKLGPAVVQFLPSVGKLRPAVVQLSLAVLQLGPGIVQLFLGLLQLGQSVLVFPLTLVILTLSVSQLGGGLVQLDCRGVQLDLAGVQLGLARVQLNLGVSQLGFSLIAGGIQSPITTGQ